MNFWVVHKTNGLITFWNIVWLSKDEEDKWYLTWLLIFFYKKLKPHKLKIFLGDLILKGVGLCLELMMSGGCKEQARSGQLGQAGLG